MKKPGTAVARRWLSPLLCAGASFLLATIVVLTAWALLPVAFGWTPVAITSGSMGPHVRVGDVVVVDTHDGRELDPATVITFRDSDRLVTHRIVSIDEAGAYTTKGDANADRDSTPVGDDTVVGSARILVPFIGRPLIWLASGQHTPLGLLVLAVVVAVPLARPGRPTTSATSPADDHASWAEASGRTVSDAALEDLLRVPVGESAERLDDLTLPDLLHGLGLADLPQRPVLAITDLVQGPGTSPARAPVDPLDRPAFCLEEIPVGVVWQASSLPRSAEAGQHRSSRTATPKDVTRTRLRLAAVSIGAVVALAGGTAAGVLLSETGAAAFSGAADNASVWTSSQLDSPTGVAVGAGCADGSPFVDVTWTPTDEADGYDIYRRTDSDGPWGLRVDISGGSLDAWRDDDVADGTFDYRVEATTSSWRSQPSTSASATVDEETCP